MESRRTEVPFFHISQAAGRSGGTRVDVRRWAFAGLVLALLGLAGWLYLEQAAEAASYGATVRQLQDQKERLRREITSLRSEVAVAGSLTRLTALAKELDYVLPEATDPVRHLVIEYPEPEPLASAVAEDAPADGKATEAETAIGRRVRAMVTQLGEWLGTPVESASAP